jgi:hypothetical protein
VGNGVLFVEAPRSDSESHTSRSQREMLKVMIKEGYLKLTKRNASRSQPKRHVSRS